MSQLKIYRASAGSGKTYTLSGEFIKLLFKDPNNYKSILAVTFTNKATAEMKSRILENLYALANDPKPDYLDELIQIYKKPEGYIRKVAKTLLRNILNDFSRFTISTIDSFFQKVIRSFAYEANLPANFKVELDTDRILSQAVDELLRELELKGNEDLKEWLIKHTLLKIEEGRDWNISAEIKSLGREVFKEEFQSISQDVLLKLRDKKLLSSYYYTLKKITVDFEKEIQTLAEKGSVILKQYGISDDILHLKSRSPLKKLDKLTGVGKSADFHDIIKLEPLADNPEVCFNKKNSDSDNSIIADCFNGGLNDILLSLFNYFNEHKTNYYTAKSILSNLNALGIITDIAVKVNELARDENLFLLSDANRLLHQIIDENETPFIYEKTGTRFLHFMIDEFQDTSHMQWGNFRPLLQNSIGEGNTSLIVGDVKQSIYRWRSSDWKLLSDQVNIDFKNHGVDSLTLDTNWRSTEDIITFNNIVFKKAAKILQDEFTNSSKESNPDNEIPEGLTNKIITAYDDTFQQVSSKAIGSGGYVHIDFIEGKNKTEFMGGATEKAVLQIEELLDAGYQYKDICILVRQKSEGQAITEALLSARHSPSGRKHPVLSNETLLLSSSPAVNIVIQQIKYIQEPDNEVHQAFIKLYHYTSHDDSDCDTSILYNTNGEEFKKLSDDLLSLKGQPLFEMAEALVRHLPDDLYRHQFVFLQGLLDTVRDYVINYSVNVHDFLNWWDDKGLNMSISVPDGQNAINVMTIHKSKGLEFKAVVVPYCNWPIDDRGHGSLIWCNPKQEPFNRLDLLPINYSAQLLHTIFINEYLNERLHQFVDNLNLLYVAFTRAEESLVVLAETPAKNGALKNVSHVLFRIVNQLNLISEVDEEVRERIMKGWDDDDRTFTFGTIPQRERIIKDAEKPTHSFKTTGLGTRIKIHPESTNYSSPEGLKHLKHGRIMHRLFELITTPEDVDTAVTQLILQGQMKTSDRNDVTGFVSSKIAQDHVKEWFNPKNKIINERPILASGGTYRPDRVIVTDNKTIVVDYKFGDMKEERHLVQVRQYMDLLAKMNYKNVEGYLWYLREEDEVINVNSKPVQGKLFE